MRAMDDERAAVKTLPRARPAPGPGARSTLADAVVLGRYRLLEQIGAGGHGSVWIARDDASRELVAVKRIAVGAVDAQERLRIEREGRAAARLEHPAIVALYDSGDDVDAHYLVSELVEGASLATLYREHALGDGELLEIGAALADALAHAHERGVVHRDVKPGNVIVPTARRGAGGPSAPAKLTDFGVARIAGEQALTRTGDVIGTLAYMAPEQADGRPAGPAADLYSLALTLYEGLAGFNPLRGRTVAATARRVGGAIAPLERSRPDLPPALCTAIDRALAPAAGARGTLAALRAALAQPPGSLTVRARRTASHRRPALSPAPRGAARRPAGASRARAQRLGAAVLAGTLCGAALAIASGPGAFAPSVCVGAGAALLVAATGAIGWLVLGLGAIGWLGAIGQPGTALIVAAALVPVPLALPGRPWLWTLPALAPALGLASLAGVAPVAAGRLGGPWWSRAALGALSYWWLALGEALSGRRLLLGLTPHAGPRTSWQGSLGAAVHHALVPLCSDGRLATAALWALAAMTLPWLVRGPHAPERVVGAIAWAGALIVAGIAVSRGLGVPAPPLPLACGVLAAALASARAPARRRVHLVADVA
jgi:eukaryotic-like serine/threonine-protein kinase